MSEITSPSITKSAKTLNGLPLDGTIQGMKTAAFFERQISEVERAQEMAKANSEVKEEKVPTGAEIRKAYQEGTYRDIGEER